MALTARPTRHGVTGSSTTHRPCLAGCQSSQPRPNRPHLPKLPRALLVAFCRQGSRNPPRLPVWPIETQARAYRRYLRFNHKPDLKPAAGLPPPDSCRPTAGACPPQWTTAAPPGQRVLPSAPGRAVQLPWRRQLRCEPSRQTNAPAPRSRNVLKRLELLPRTTATTERRPEPKPRPVKAVPQLPRATIFQPHYSSAAGGSRVMTPPPVPISAGPTA